jgi:hypothetical protein
MVALRTSPTVFSPDSERVRRIFQGSRTCSIGTSSEIAEDGWSSIVRIYFAFTLNPSSTGRPMAYTGDRIALSPASVSLTTVLWSLP